MSLIDRVLEEKEVNRKIRDPGVYYVTELVGPCLRATYYGLFLDRPSEIETLRIFNAGNVIEDYWLQVLSQARGYTILGRQLPARESFYIGEDYVSIHGRIDALVQHPDTRIFIHEVKTKKNLYYVGEAADEEHAQQVGFYSYVTGIRHAQVDYLDKSNFLQGEGPIDRSIVVPYSEAHYMNTVSTSRALHGFVKAKRLPPRAGSGCWKCGLDRKTGRPWCPYKAECDADKNIQEIMEDDPKT